MCDSTGALNCIGDNTYTRRKKYIALLFNSKELITSCFHGMDKILEDTCTKYFNTEIFTETSAKKDVPGTTTE